MKVRQVGDPVLFCKAEEVDLSLINKKEIKYLRRELARQTKEETTYFGGINDDYKRNH